MTTYLTTYYTKSKTDPVYHIGQAEWLGRTLCGLKLRAAERYSTDLLSPSKRLCPRCLGIIHQLS